LKPFTRGLPPPDPHSLCLLSSANFVELPPHRKNSWVRYWWQHAVDRSTDPWLLNGEVVCTSRSLFRSAANFTWLPLRISKVPVFLCHLVFTVHQVTWGFSPDIHRNIWIITFVSTQKFRF
jgi:hypothetical protein